MLNSWHRVIFSFVYMSSSQPCTALRSQKGTQQRLKDIEDALAGRPIASETCSSQSQTPAIPLTGREKRLKDIEDALAGKFVPSGMTQMNTPPIRVPNLKRTSCATPESPPCAKRRQLSPDSSDSSPLPSPTSASCSSFGSLPGSSITDATSSVHSSPSPEPVVTSLPEVRHYTDSIGPETHGKIFAGFMPTFCTI